jgi:putative ABC transport system substrate-binding protein
VIVAPASTAGALASKAATTTIPIVFATGSDPVALGLVPSLSRPGGNVTGVTILGVELTAKRLSLLRELTPQATRFVALVNPRSVMADGIVKNVEASAPILGCQSKSSTPAPIASSWRRCRDFRKGPAQYCWLPWMASSSTAAP